MSSPKVLYLDEPTRGLDLPAKRDMWNLLKRLAAEDNVITFLWIRHVPARGASVLDGYSALQVPEARTAGTDVDWSRFAGIHEDHACRVSSR